MNHSFEKVFIQLNKPIRTSIQFDHLSNLINYNNYSSNFQNFINNSKIYCQQQLQSQQIINKSSISKPSNNQINDIFKQNSNFSQLYSLTYDKNYMNIFYEHRLLNLIFCFLDLEDLLILRNTHLKCKLFVQQFIFNKIVKNKYSSTYFWESVVNYKKILRNNMSYYHLNYFLQQQESQYSRDLDRTFLTQQIQTVQGQTKLNRLLKALDSTVGYFQGLNYIAAAFLYKYTEEQSYWFIRFLLNKMNFLQNKIEKFHQFMDKLQQVFETELPNIFEHILEMEIDIKYFASKWILTLYSYDCKVEVMLKLWQLLAVTNEKFLISFTISILKQLEVQILKCDEEQLNILLKFDLKQHINDLNESQLFEKSIKRYIDWNEVIQCLCIYDQSVDQNIYINQILN